MRLFALVLLLVLPLQDKLTESQAKELFDKAMKLHEEKKYPQAIAEFTKIARDLPDTDVGRNSAYNIACAYALQGKKAEALRWLERAVEHGYSDADWMEEDTDLESLRGEKRYQQIIRKLKNGDEPEETPPEWTAVDALRVNGIVLEIRAAPPGNPAEERPAYRLQAPGKDDEYAVLYTKDGRPTRIEEFPSGKLLCRLPADPPCVWSVTELFWEAFLSYLWELQGDSLLAASSPSQEALIKAITAYEYSANPRLLKPALYPKLAGAYLELLKSPDAPEAVIRHIASSLLRMPGEIEGDADQKHSYAFVRACAFFRARCHPRAAAEIARAGDGEDAAGLRSILATLGVDRFENLSTFSSDSFSVSAWKCNGAPARDALPRYETCFVAESKGRLKTFLVSRQQISGKTLRFLHAADLAGETLLESYGEREPSFDELQRRVVAALRAAGPEPAAPDPVLDAIPAGDAAEGGSGALQVRWSNADGYRLEFRRGGLEAGVWIGPALVSPLSVQDLPAGPYVAYLRDPFGKVIKSRPVTVAPSGTLEVDLNDFR